MMKNWLIICLVVGGLLLAHSPAAALEGKFKEDFSTLSGQSRLAMELSSAELKTLIEGCDNLLDQTASLQKSEKKIMTKRLTRLRGLFSFVLESKQAAKETTPATQPVSK